jgi:hypothetical protein
VLENWLLADTVFDVVLAVTAERLCLSLAYSDHSKAKDQIPSCGRLRAILVLSFSADQDAFARWITSSWIATEYAVKSWNFGGNGFTN